MFDQQWNMLVKCGTNRLTKRCCWSAYELVSPDAYVDDTEASNAGASGMASTPLAESSRRHNPQASVSATELVRRASSSLRKSEQLLLSKPRTKRLSTSFFYHASLLRNLLPANIQNLQKSEDFKLAVEQHWRTAVLLISFTTMAAVTSRPTKTGVAKQLPAGRHVSPHTK